MIRVQPVPHALQRMQFFREARQDSQVVTTVFRQTPKTR